MEESKQKLPWRSNLRALQIRVRERLRVSCSPRAFLLRHLSARRRASSAYHPPHALLGSAAVSIKPLNAILSSLLARQMRFPPPSPPSPSPAPYGRLSAPSDERRGEAPPSSSDSSPAAVDQQIEDKYTAVFHENSRIVRILQSVALPLIGNVCHAFMHSFNTTEVYCVDKLLNAVLNRPQGQALITVSNHVASVDDPLVLAAMLPPHVLLDANRLRWTLCATDRCFTNTATSTFFRCVKVLPLARGAGVYQKGIDMAVEKLRKGDWIHIFPEGSRSRDGGKTIQSAKRGIGRLALDAGDIPPIVLPFVHSGMQEVMPIGRKFPSVRKRVVVLVGDPIQVDDIFAKYKEGMISKTVAHEAIAFRVGQHLQELKLELDELCGIERSISSDSEEESLNKLRYRNNIRDATSKQLVYYNRHTGDDKFNGTNSGRLFSDGALYSDSERLNFQEGVIARLKRFKDPAAFVSFAAQGLLRYNQHTHDIRKWYLREKASYFG